MVEVRNLLPCCRVPYPGRVVVVLIPGSPIPESYNRLAITANCPGQDGIFVPERLAHVFATFRVTQPDGIGRISDQDNSAIGAEGQRKDHLVVRQNGSDGGSGSYSPEPSSTISRAGKDGFAVRAN